MKILTILFFAIISNTAFADDKNPMIGMLDDAHKFGVTKCDSTILKRSNLKDEPNWFYQVDSPTHSLGKGVASVSILSVYGSEGDTVSDDVEYIQANGMCFVNDRLTTTFSGTCASNIDGDKWYVKDQLDHTDYVLYQNAGKVDLYAKEIKVGNFNACVLQYNMASYYKQD